MIVITTLHFLLLTDGSLGTSHSFIPTANSPTDFKNLVASSGSRGSKHIPVILAGPSTSSREAVTETMDKWTSIARAGGSKTPFLWVGPTAASQKSSGFGIDEGLGNSKDVQDTFFSTSAAQSRGMEVLGMYNATLKASSWDGSSYGERVSLVQAMMVSSSSFFSIFLASSVSLINLFSLSTGFHVCETETLKRVRLCGKSLG